MPNTTDDFNIPFLDGTELVRDYPQFSEDLADAVDAAIPRDATTSVAGVVLGTTSDGANTALGAGAFKSNTTGSENTAVGQQALRDNTTGAQNTALGRNTLVFNTGSANTAVGARAMTGNTTGTSNTGVGFNTLLNNTTGANNTGVGFNTLQNNTTGIQNTAVGRDALQNNTTANDNTGLGLGALQNTTGGNNTGVGRAALQGNTTGVNNTGLGRTSTGSSPTVNNQITLGDSNISSLRCNVTTISSLSDVRDKTDIVDTQHGLDTLNKIRPVDFTWARRDGTFGSAPDIGFIAQELASVEDETGDAQRLRLTLRDNPEKLEATPGRLIPILVKAVQELSAKNDELEARLVKLEGK